MKTHVEGVISNFTGKCSTSQTVHLKNSFSDSAVEPHQAYRLQWQERQTLSCIHKTAPVSCTHTHAELKCHYLAGTEELNKTEETGNERKRETKMLFNSFIIQMNENHINASKTRPRICLKISSPITAVS